MSIYVAIAEEDCEDYSVVTGQCVGYEEVDDEIIPLESISDHLLSKSGPYGYFKFKWEKIDFIPEIFPPTLA
jgi:hypothetical protein